MSAELRLPVLGVRPLSLVDFGALPTELALFADAGLAWSAGDALSLSPLDLGEVSSRQRPVVSAGVSVRVNLLSSVILEPYWAYAFQRNTPSFFGLRLQPGW